MTEREQHEEFADFSNVETQIKYLVPEELPEGPYGSPINKDKPVESKSTPWEEGQTFYSPFTYENRTLHQDLPRQMEGAHPPHDDKDTDHEMPYTTP